MYLRDLSGDSAISSSPLPHCRLLDCSALHGGGDVICSLLLFISTFGLIKALYGD